jgi:GT2 family glycosyltransferase
MISHPEVEGLLNTFSTKSILAVIVLYKRQAGESQSFTSLRNFLAQDSALASVLDLIICDNTPYPQTQPADFDDLYVQDQSNPGLARCYNLALSVAAERRIPWLMLLDQDTVLTEKYLDECLSVVSTLREQPDAVAMVPRLVNQGSVCSPHFAPFMGPARAVGPQMAGLAREHLYVFNSGAILRVDALQAIGGFPSEYPLDFLDHATFSELQVRGGRLFLLQAVLEHDLSTNDHGRHDPALVPRQIGILDAEYRYYSQYGSARDRALRRLRLLRAAAGRIARGKNREQTWRILKAAFRP